MADKWTRVDLDRNKLGEVVDLISIDRRWAEARVEFKDMADEVVVHDFYGPDAGSQAGERIIDLFVKVDDDPSKPGFSVVQLQYTLNRENAIVKGSERVGTKYFKSDVGDPSKAGSEGFDGDNPNDTYAARVASQFKRFADLEAVITPLLPKRPETPPPPPAPPAPPPKAVAVAPAGGYAATTPGSTNLDQPSLVQIAAGLPKFAPEMFVTSGVGKMEGDKTKGKYTAEVFIDNDRDKDNGYIRLIISGEPGPTAGSITGVSVEKIERVGGADGDTNSKYLTELGKTGAIDVGTILQNLHLTFPEPAAGGTAAPVALTSGQKLNERTTDGKAIVFQAGSSFDVDAGSSLDRVATVSTVSATDVNVSYTLDGNSLGDGKIKAGSPPLVVNLGDGVLRGLSPVPIKDPVQHTLVITAGDAPPVKIVFTVKPHLVELGPVGTYKIPLAGGGNFVITAKGKSGDTTLEVTAGDPIELCTVSTEGTPSPAGTVAVTPYKVAFDFDPTSYDMSFTAGTPPKQFGFNGTSAKPGEPTTTSLAPTPPATEAPHLVQFMVNGQAVKIPFKIKAKPVEAAPTYVINSLELTSPIVQGTAAALVINGTASANMPRDAKVKKRIEILNADDTSLEPAKVFDSEAGFIAATRDLPIGRDGKGLNYKVRVTVTYRDAADAKALFSDTREKLLTVNPKRVVEKPKGPRRAPGGHHGQ